MEWGGEDRKGGGGKWNSNSDFDLCTCAHVRAGCSRECVCVEEYCRDQFTVVCVRCLSSEPFILAMCVLVQT